MTGVSVTQESDQLIAVHLNGGNDLVLCLQSANNNEERVGELVGVIANNMKKSVSNIIWQICHNSVVIANNMKKSVSRSVVWKVTIGKFATTVIAINMKKSVSQSVI